MSTAQAVSLVKQALLEKLQQEIVPQLQRLVAALPEQLVDFAQAETQLRDELLHVAQPLLDIWAHVADMKVARPDCPTCAVPMRHRGLPETGVVTTLGEVNYRRPRWRCESCGTECYPHDALLRFLTHNVSWPLAKVCSRLAAQIPSFADATDTLAEDYRVHLAKETIRSIAETAGTTVVAQEDTQRRRVMERQAPLPESAKQPETACVFADGTTVHSDGDWHEIRVATVATEDAQGKPLERQSRARFLGVEEVAWTMVLLARSVGYQNAKQRAFIADGAAWLWKLQEAYFGSATAILDWYHLAEHVHKAANVVYGQGSQEAHQWAKQLKTELWEGRAAIALTLARQEHAKARAPSKREALQELVTYLDNNQHHMDYPRYRALGLPVGSGQVEAQCKTLVGGRCKQAGMRNWTYQGAEAILRMRAARQDGSFDELWNRKLRLAG
jgi:Uncharacterised protein family (UPF0236)